MTYLASNNSRDLRTKMSSRAAFLGKGFTNSEQWAHLNPRNPKASRLREGGEGLKKWNPQPGFLAMTFLVANDSHSANRKTCMVMPRPGPQVS